MKDIAQKLGISINAVSLALNNKVGVSEETRRKVLRVANEMGYLNNRNKYIRTFAYYNICVMMQKMYSTDMGFYSKILYSIVDEAKKNGYDTLINFFDDIDFAVPECISKSRIAGIIVIGKINDDNIDILKSYGLPIVLVDHASLSKRVDSILTDNKLGGFMKTKYLIDRGFETIGFFGDLDYSLSIKERFFGFIEALRSYGIKEIRDNLIEHIGRYSIISNIEKAVIDHDIDYIVHCISRIKTLPQAFICSNDNAAIALSRALQTMGYSIPDDISLIGFDNIDMCEKVSPKLTTINVNKEVMGKRAVQRIMYIIDHPRSRPENVVLSVELVERDSVKAIHKDTFL